MKPHTLCLCALLLMSAPLAADSLLAGGHVKARLNLAEIPSDSLFREFLDNPAFDQGADLRLKFRAQGDHWGADADYQLIRTASDGNLVTTTINDEVSYDHDVVRLGVNYRF